MQYEITIELTPEQQKSVATEFGEAFESLSLTVVGERTLAFFNQSPAQIRLTSQQKAIVKETIGKEIEEVFFRRPGAGVWGATWSTPEDRQSGRLGAIEGRVEPTVQGTLCLKDFPRKWPALRDRIRLTTEVDNILGDFRNRFLQAEGTVGNRLGKLFDDIEIELTTIFIAHENLAAEAHEIVQMNAPLLNAAVQLKSFANAQSLGLNVTIPEAHVNKAVAFLDNLAEAAPPNYKESITYTGQLTRQLTGRTLLEATTLLDMPDPNI